MKLSPLPSIALRILEELNAPPRPRAHLTLVHDVALQLIRAFESRWPHLALDAQVVSVSAALHDVGKALVTIELSEPGVRHESEGERILLAHNVEDRIARMGRTHGDILSHTPEVEELLVVLADKPWKSKRDQALEQAFVSLLATRSETDEWEVFDWLDQLATSIGEAADSRFAWQAQHPASHA